MKVIPAEFARDAHHWLILHGRYLCKARRPECWRCPVAAVCRYRAKSADPAAVPHTLGVKPSPAAARKRAGAG
jgi:endonuclease-3